MLWQNMLHILTPYRPPAMYFPNALTYVYHLVTLLNPLCLFVFPLSIFVYQFELCVFFFVIISDLDDLCYQICILFSTSPQSPQLSIFGTYLSYLSI